MTLPTRPDGGIDWENWLSKSLYGYSTQEVKQATAATRERCAKICEAVYFEARDARLTCAAAIRKMED